MATKTQAMIWTDKELEALERQIREVYERASKEVTEKMERYLERFAKQDAVMAQKLHDGLITKQEYATWRTNHFMMGKNWEAMRNTLTEDLVNTDKIASKMINESLTNVYAENANYTAYEIEKGANANLSFSLYDKKAVENLLSEKANFIPQVNPKIPIDERWNRQHIVSEMLQGILQGESIPKISKRLANVTTMDKNGAIRNARTYTTSVENQAKMDRYSEAEDMGIELDKEWMATLDERTRESHRELDGERRANDELFSNGLMYPADPNGAPEEVYNCRCRIVARIKDHNYDRSGRFERFDNTSYEEWKKAKEKEEPQKERIECSKIKNSMSEENYNEFMDLVNASENGKLYEDYADTVGTVRQTKNGGAYNSARNTLEYSISDYEGTSKYSVCAHEHNHLFDERLGKSDKLTFTQRDLINERCQIGSGSIKPIKEYASTSDEFMTALRQDMDALKTKGIAECYEEFKESKAIFNATGGVQDALDGFFHTQKNYYGWGHGDRYYNSMYNDWIKRFGNEKNLKDALNELGFDASNQTKAKEIFRQFRASNEAWANVGSAVTCGGEELKAFEKYMPNTLETYRKIIGEV